MAKLVVAWHSGYGHTKRVADALAEGARGVRGTELRMLEVDRIDDAGWALLEQADAIVFGAPTYMGGVSGPFKTFCDLSSSRAWATRRWKDKLAGGFTCSLQMSGDKLGSLQYMVTFAMQHGMVWVGPCLPPPREPGDPSEINRLGSDLGLMAQAGNVSPELEPPDGDLDGARQYGERIARMADAWGTARRAGRAA